VYWDMSFKHVFFYHCRRTSSLESFHLIGSLLSPLMLWVQISIRARCTTLCDKVCQWLTTGRWFSPGTPVSSTNKTDHHDITEILLKVALKLKMNLINKIWNCSQSCQRQSIIGYVESISRKLDNQGYLVVNYLVWFIMCL
jgi:hypothetical protein